MTTAVSLVAPPSPLWFFARAAGFVSLLLLAVTVAVGMLVGARVTFRRWPLFALDELHRFLVLLFFTFLALHVGTVLIDPFTHFRLADVVVPFGSDYRRLWMGLGILTAEAGLALSLSVHLRRWIGHRAWRVLHYGTYALYPPVMLHGMGTGTDTSNGWALALYALSGAVVLAAATVRTLRATSRRRLVRVPALLGLAAATAAVVTWSMHGPLAPGWSRAAGTPSETHAIPVRVASDGTRVPQWSVGTAPPATEASP